MPPRRGSFPAFYGHFPAVACVVRARLFVCGTALFGCGQDVGGGTLPGCSCGEGVGSLACAFVADSVSMGFEIDPAWLFLSLIPGGVGFVLFVYGKKQARVPQLIAGLAMMAYPYFATTVTTLLAGGTLITAGLWYALWLGY